MSYTRSLVDGVIKAKHKKWISGNVIELGENNYYPATVEKYIKASDPSYHTCRSAQELWIGAGAASYIVHNDFESLPPIQYDVVVNQAWLEDELDVAETLRKTHQALKVGGFLFTNLPLGLTVAHNNFSPNFWQTFCKLNGYEVRFCQVSDENANWPILIPMGHRYTWTKLKDVLYKFRETWSLRITLVLQKKKDEELIFRRPV